MSSGAGWANHGHLDLPGPWRWLDGWCWTRRWRSGFLGDRGGVRRSCRRFCRLWTKAAFLGGEERVRSASAGGIAAGDMGRHLAAARLGYLKEHAAERCEPTSRASGWSPRLLIPRRLSLEHNDVHRFFKTRS